MNKLRKNSLAKSMLLLFKSLWYVQIVLFPILIVLVSVSMSSDSRTFRWPVHYDLHINDNISPEQEGINSARIETSNGYITFESQIKWQSITITLGGLLLVMTKSLWITFLFRKLTQSFVSHEPFLKINLNRIRLIGWVLIGFTFIELIFGIVFSQYLNQSFSGVHFNFDFNVRQLIFGLLVLLIGLSFEIGINYREENELTV